MNEFTKGPYHVIDRDTGGVFTSIISENGQSMAWVNTVPKEGQHNARLIAAAGTAATKAAEMGFDGVRAIEALPELLYACRDALDSTDCNCGMQCNGTCTHAVLRAALTKARGKE